MIFHNGDCLDKLKDLADNSIDSLVTDPPAGISFMGKSWDSDKGGRKEWCAWMSEVMRECLRVMKPGAHGLVWAIPRTSHWTATALEDAGFEIRDVVTHLFGSGFPKSLDISKAIDKSAGAEREILGPKSTYRKPQISPNGNVCLKREPNETAPATDSAKEWQGWGTALKPASEHWILVRKPCSEKTVAANVQKWGTGGINIDGSRIASTDFSPKERLGATKLMEDRPWSKNQLESGERKIIIEGHSQGRFPANLVLSHSPNCNENACDMFDCAVWKLDEQSGIREGGHYPKKGNAGIFGGAEAYIGNDFRDKPGGASRFFYCAKISTSERNNAGENKHPTVKPKKLMSYLIKLITPPNGTVLDPFMGSGSTGIAAKENSFDFIGIEKELEYFEIAKARIDNTTNIVNIV